MAKSDKTHIVTAETVADNVTPLDAALAINPDATALIECDTVTSALTVLDECDTFRSHIAHNTIYASLAYGILGNAHRALIAMRVEAAEEANAALLADPGEFDFLKAAHGDQVERVLSTEHAEDNGLAPLPLPDYTDMKFHAVMVGLYTHLVRHERNPDNTPRWVVNGQKIVASSPNEILLAIQTQEYRAEEPDFSSEEIELLRKEFTDLGGSMTVADLDKLTAEQKAHKDKKLREDRTLILSSIARAGSAPLELIWDLLPNWMQYRYAHAVRKQLLKAMQKCIEDMTRAFNNAERRGKLRENSERIRAALTDINAELLPARRHPEVCLAFASERLTEEKHGLDHVPGLANGPEKATKPQGKAAGTRRPGSKNSKPADPLLLDALAEKFSQ